MIFAARLTSRGGLATTPGRSASCVTVTPSAEEPDAEKALLLRAAILDEAVRALVPALWLYEVGNTVARRFPAHAEAWTSALMRFGLEEAPLSEAWLAKSLELTRRHGVSFYDATYHALALIHKGRFITGDAKYVARAAASGSVSLLADWQAPRRGRA